MSLPKLLVTVTILLFGSISLAAWLKRDMGGREELRESSIGAVEEVELPQSFIQTESKKIDPVPFAAVNTTPMLAPEAQSADGLPNADLVQRLFHPGQPMLPIVETITYSSRVPWQNERAAWVADYAAHYNTSRHFIARSLNRKPDYFTQNVANGDRFNVLKEGKNISFYLLVDLSRCKLWFYYLDGDSNERVLLKRYDVGLGRQDPSRGSGSLTPLGKYSLGSKVAIYRPTVTGIYQGERVEMVRIFGSRWIPFDQELAHCTEPAKGFGLHGAPYVEEGEAKELKESLAGIGRYDSDGCIRLAAADIEELFSIVISRPTTVEIVSDFHDAQLPGEEATF